ncbi:hypothetical protein [Polyangium aurulentum]|uniref:hypothetical protein n=1 Tax=Polyangium aurulentum TaxID=2567896 RepID=UPI001469FB89|nr:hypothetical protein [Polyangium aurulentum]UQA60408.1 hypothetical protein E8A73_008015 [Polyangium aurulentum]
MSVAEIDSEKQTNVVSTDPLLGPWTHCVVIMEQPPLLGDDPPPRWRLSATLTLRDTIAGNVEAMQADLPTVVVGPLIHKRQIVALAKYPGLVSRWLFRFESDDGRARARVWLHPGNSPMGECGIFVVPHPGR